MTLRTSVSGLAATVMATCMFAGPGSGLAGTTAPAASRLPSDEVAIALCRISYDIRTDDVIVSDHTHEDNPPIGDLVFTKACTGPVVGTFSAEITGNLHIHRFWAYCVGPSTVPGGCTRGQSLFASAHTLLRSDGTVEVSWPVQTVTWVWPSVPPGRWRFRLLPASFSAVTVKNRTFIVEAYKAP